MIIMVSEKYINIKEFYRNWMLSTSTKLGDCVVTIFKQ